MNNHCCLLSTTEFAQHHQLHALGFQTFFCDTHSPWHIENAIGRLRRTLPRKTDLATLADDRFTQLVQADNNTPRKCLGYNTPAETFWNQVLVNPHSRLRGNDELRGRNATLGCRCSGDGGWCRRPVAELIPDRSPGWRTCFPTNSGKMR